MIEQNKRPAPVGKTAPTKPARPVKNHLTTQMKRAVEKVRQGERSPIDVIGLTPRDISGFVKLGAHALGAGDARTAIAAGTVAVAIDEASVDGWLLIAAGHASAGLHAPAIAAYTRVTTLAPNNLRAWVDLADLHLSAPDFAAAAVALRHAVALDPSAETPLGLRAQVLIVQTLQTHEV